MNIKNLFYLDLRICTIYGYENQKSIQVIESMIKGIKVGDKFPPVKLFHVKNLEFSLSSYQYTQDIENNPVIDGGHHRVIAHYIEDTPLLCEPVKRIMSIPGLPGQIEHTRNIIIPNIEIIEDQNLYLNKKKMFEIYR
jgi:hypothetical protein|tara:strand:- start:402 stop:815 length:414 start_codon:yes stop_codon:yes gene_type:complete